MQIDELHAAGERGDGFCQALLTGCGSGFLPAPLLQCVDVALECAVQVLRLWRRDGWFGGTAVQDVMAAARQRGLMRLAQVHYAVAERDGKISIVENDGTQ
jgi:hypothetical protein